MAIGRRTFLKSAFRHGAVLGLAPLLGRAGRAESIPSRWPSVAIQVPSDQAGHKPPVVTSVAIHPGERLLATAGDDHLVYLWDIAQERIVHTLRGHADWVHSLVFSPNHQILASAGSDHRVIFWDVHSAVPLAELDSQDHPVTALRWSHDGAMIAVIGFQNRLRIYDAVSRDLIRELECPSADMRTLDFSPDDRQIAAGGRDGCYRIWNVADWSVARDFNPHQRRIRGLSYSPDGRFLVSSGEDRCIHVQDTRNDDDFHITGCSAKILSLVFYGPRELATGCSDNLIRLWDLQGRTEIGQLRGHTGSVATLDCRGKLFVSGSFDTTVRIWTISDALARDDQKDQGETIRTRRISK